MATIADDLPPLPSPERLQELLFDAARIGRDEVIPALLRAGADIEGTDARGYSALVLASYNGQQSTTALLLGEGAKPDSSSGNSALMGVAFKGYAGIARTLVEAGVEVDHRNGVGQTALMMAAMFGQGEIVDLLLAAGADPSIADAAGNTARSVALAQGNRAMADRFPDQAVETMPSATV